MSTKSHIAILLFSLLILSFVNQKLIVTLDLLVESYSQIVSLSKAQNLVNSFSKYQWVSYLAIPIILLLKWLLVSSLIYSALFFAQIETAFKDIWRLAIQAEWVFVIAALVKFCWFYFFNTNYTLEDLQFFYPLSALNLFTPEELESWWVYPLQLVNAFEVTYWFVLAYLLGKAIKRSTSKAFDFVVLGYGSGMLLWVLLVVFITLNFSV